MLSVKNKQQQIPTQKLIYFVIRFYEKSKYMFFFYKHMKFRNQARLCFAVFNFEAHIMLSLCLTFHGRLPYRTTGMGKI